MVIVNCHRVAMYCRDPYGIVLHLVIFVIFIFVVCNRDHAAGGPGRPWPLYFSAEQKKFVAQKRNCLKTRLGRHFLES